MEKYRPKLLMIKYENSTENNILYNLNEQQRSLCSGIWYLACEYKITNAVLSYVLFERCREGV